MSRRISESLRLQLFFFVLIALFAGGVVFCTSFFVGEVLLDKTVYGQSFSEKMADQQFSKLQEYVEKESVSVDNLRRLNAWCSRGEKVHLSIYRDDVLIYESHVFNDRNDNLHGQELTAGMEDPDNEYILTLQGDIKVRAFLYYYVGDAFYFWKTVISGLLAFVVFSLSFIFLISRKISYITRLKGDLDILSGGQLAYPVTIIGKDELGELASGIDQMRRSIIRHQELEMQMRTANSELITAMSHDLRTPLTSLLAYLEIVERKKYTDEKQMDELIHKSVGQAMRIRQMADKLFAYFMAYATEWADVDMEAVDADPLFCQILGEYILALESKGMQVKLEFSDVSGKINVNMGLMQRALDNLYSNLLKYADPAVEIRIVYKREGEDLLLTMFNGIRSNSVKAESTSIGLITCRRIIEYHKGYFTAGDSSQGFLVSVTIPLQNSKNTVCEEL